MDVSALLSLGCWTDFVEVTDESAVAVTFWNMKTPKDTALSTSVRLSENTVIYIKMEVPVRCTPELVAEFESL